MIHQEPLKAKKAKADTQQKAWKPKGTWEQPKMKGSKSPDLVCPYCSAQIKATYEICPHCGRSLSDDKCTFCGAPKRAGAKFCTNCGQSQQGVVCPECGTLNSRNFCRKCGAALTPMGIAAAKAAQADPAFQAVEAKARELAELHARIEELKNAPAPEGSEPPQLSEADQAMLDEYADLLGSIGACRPQAPQPQEQKARPQYADISMTLEEMTAAYRAKADEMNAALEAMVPPPDFTPEQQRDYYSARKVSKVVTEYDMSGYTPQMWVCNFCGFYHHQPTECAEPQLGGKWVYIPPEDYVKENASFLNSKSYIQID